MRIVEEELPDMPGQDAFLDVLTNMVGIIILLVVVMGLRSSRAASAALAEEDPILAASAARTKTVAELSNTSREVTHAENKLRHLMGQAVNARRETLLREQERQYLTTYVAAFDQELSERRTTLTTEQQRDFDLRRQLAQAQMTLDELTRDQVSLLSQPAETEVLENRPTPIVKNRSGKQVFLQLSAGQVVMIPVADLAEECKQHIEQNVWRLRDEKKFFGTVGPIGGFRMRYVVRKRAVLRESPNGSIQQGASIETECEFLPVDSLLGEPVEQALAADSELFGQLANFPPDSTVVAIAVYPDSLRQLHSLKRALHDAGYGVAELLMVEGHPFGFAPRGQAILAQ